VEHPVTELVTGLDLVALQLAVAEGEALPPAALHPAISGHAVEARLYAEDVAAGYLPATGTLHRFELPSLPGVRVDAGVQRGSQVSVYYDPMLAKVIAHAPSRQQAARLLARTLAEARLHGVVTNRDLLVGILREQEFLDSAIDTGYLTRHDPADLVRRDPTRDRLHALATALADQAAGRDRATVLATLPSGWRNVPNGPQRVTYESAGRPLAVDYRIAGARVEATVDGSDLGAVLVHECGPHDVDVEVAGRRRRIRVERAGDLRYADSPLGATTLLELPRFPEPVSEAATGSLLAPMPGTVVRVETRAGDAVRAGQILVVLEAMKMEHSVVAPHDGTVTTLAATLGQSVDQGTVLAVVEGTDDE